MDSNEEEQANELLALESIYSCNDDVLSYRKIDINPSQLYKGHVACSIKLDSDLEISAVISGTVSTGSVNYLPPVYFSFRLGSNYPSSQPPDFSLSASWLNSSTEAALREKLVKLWAENVGMSILFTWIQCIEEECGSLLNGKLSLADSVNEVPDRKSFDRSISEEQYSPHYSPPQLFAMLLDYDSLQRKKEFDRNRYECEVCFLEYIGSDCVQFLPCRHIFCRECVGGYFNCLINDGNVRNLKCLSEKCESMATPQQVREVLGSEAAYERYESLLLNHTLDLMADVVPCPRTACQGPVILDKESEAKEGGAVQRVLRMATCPTCDFTFCTYCRKGYHGIAPCTFSSRDARKLADEYQSGDGDMKRLMEFRYGRETLVKLVNEALAEAWIGENSKKCPHCNVNIEKKDGCNKMWCQRCGSYFCWLCFAILNQQDPYAHFNKPSGNCYNKLFFGIEDNDDFFEDEDDDDW